MPTPTWLTPFSPQFRGPIEQLLRSQAERRVACFDADGTVWSGDIGEAFLRWLVAGGLVGGGRSVDAVWDDYEARVDANQCEGYAWAVASMAGLVEADVVRWARQFAAAWPTYRPAMVDLMRGLEASGVEVWWVSASSRWVVQAAAERIGVGATRVLGVAVPVTEGVLGDTVIRPMTCRAGKAAVIAAAIGVAPDLGFGDSRGDLEMMEASRQPMIVARADRPDSAFVVDAAQRGWPVQHF